jgi:hypothetical protein
MANSRPNVQVFGYPVKLRGEKDVPSFRVKPPEEAVPGFHLNPDGSARRPAERRLNLPVTRRLLSLPPSRTRRSSRESRRSLAWRWKWRRSRRSRRSGWRETDLGFRPSC